jgi:phage FluMu protein Com
MNLTENRCKEVVVRKGMVTVCNSLLFKGDISAGIIEIKCNSCGGMTVVKAKAVVVRNRIPVKSLAV